MLYARIFVVLVVLVPLLFVAGGRLRIDVAALQIAALLGQADRPGLPSVSHPAWPVFAAESCAAARIA